MNKEELKELAAVLNGIADGRTWQRKHLGSWEDAHPADDPVDRIAAGYNVHLKPWSLPPPPDGMQWHREDGWTEEMLDGGWRPHLLGDVDNGDDEFLIAGEWKKGYYGSSVPTVASDHHRRTKAPLPQPDPYAELKAAHAAGKVIQHRFPGYLDWNDTSHPEFLRSREYRIKPEQQKVPIGPSDAPPGSAFRFNGHSDDHYYLPTLAAGGSDGVYFTDTVSFRRDWNYLIDKAMVNRSIPLTGKWNPEAWEPCYKLIDTP